MEYYQVKDIQENHEGYVVDIECLRHYPENDLVERARDHTKRCGLDGHCVESGYALVNDSGETFLLDSEATPMVFNALKQSPLERGVKLRVHRESRGDEMRTTRVDLL